MHPGQAKVQPISKHLCAQPQMHKLQQHSEQFHAKGRLGLSSQSLYRSEFEIQHRHRSRLSLEPFFASKSPRTHLAPLGAVFVLLP